MKQPKCTRCGSPCDYAGAWTSEGCVNPDCPFFADAETRDILADLKRATDRLKEVLQCE